LSSKKTFFTLVVSIVVAAALIPILDWANASDAVRIPLGITCLITLICVIPEFRQAIADMFSGNP